MGKLFETIRRLVGEGRYIIGQHAAERLDQRHILEWQVVDGAADGQLLAERSDATPNPVAEVEQMLADGTRVKAVWALIVSLDAAKLVTVHFLTE